MTGERLPLVGNEHSIGLRKAFGARKVRPAVVDFRVPVLRTRERYERLGIIACTEDEEAGTRRYMFAKDAGAGRELFRGKTVLPEQFS